MGASLSKKKAVSLVSDLNDNDLLAEIGRRHKNVTSTLAKVSKDAHACQKALDGIAGDICPVLCDTLIGSYNGFKSSPVKLADNAITIALKDVQSKFDRYCEDKYSCAYQGKGFSIKSSEDAGSSGVHASDSQSNHADQTEMPGETSQTLDEL